MKPEAPHPFSQKPLIEHYTGPFNIFSCLFLNVNNNFIILLRLKSPQLLETRASAEILWEFPTIKMARTICSISLLSFEFGEKYKLEILRNSSATHQIASPRETPTLFGIFYRTFAEYFQCHLYNRIFELTSLIINTKIRENIGPNNEFNIVLQSSRRDI